MGANANRFLFRWQALFPLELHRVPEVSRLESLPERCGWAEPFLWVQDSRLAWHGEAYRREWLRRWSGNSTYEKIWLPLLKAKLGDAYQRASASFIWAYIDRMYKPVAVE